MSWKAPITMLVLFVVLLGAAFYGWQTIISPATEEDDPPAATDPKCDRTQDFKKGQVIKTSDIIVNVYNAGGIANLASETLATLDNRGFKAGVSDNAPASTSAMNVTIITDAKNAPQIKLVAQQFRGTVRYTKGSALAVGVDIIVGDNFQGFDPGGKRSLRVTRDVTTCVDVETAAS